MGEIGRWQTANGLVEGTIEKQSLLTELHSDPQGSLFYFFGFLFLASAVFVFSTWFLSGAGIPSSRRFALTLTTWQILANVATENGNFPLSK